MKRLRCLASLALVMSCGVGCSCLYYGAMEKIGVPKREILVSRVKGARDSQQAAKKEFADALQEFRSVVSVPGGDLETQYDKLNSALGRSESRAADVRERIDSVESVSRALFREWSAELRQYTNPELKRSSRLRLDEARSRYDALMAAMRQAESRLDPVLRPMRDQVLFLKHNLNAKAIGALTEEVASIQMRVDDLVKDMEASIREADAFIAALDASR